MKRRALLWLVVVLVMCLAGTVFAQSGNTQSVTTGTGLDDVSFKISLEGGNFSKSVSLLLLMTALSLAPAAMMMMTSFTRIVIVLSFLRRALGTQSAPSNKIIAGLALFLTIFIMQPVWVDVYQNSIKPYSDGKIDQMAAVDAAVNPFKTFMLKQTRESSLLLFMDLANMEPVNSPEELPMNVIIPAFMVSELKTAFQMGFLIYLPFLLVDIVIATTLMSMGMMMLPPMMISLPFKILLFVIVDGWGLVIRSLVSSFA